MNCLNSMQLLSNAKAFSSFLTNFFQKQLTIVEIWQSVELCVVCCFLMRVVRIVDCFCCVPEFVISHIITNTLCMMSFCTCYSKKSFRKFRKRKWTDVVLFWVHSFLWAFLSTNDPLDIFALKLLFIFEQTS